MVSRLEINVDRLLSRCEIMAKENTKMEWRMEMYIQSLEGMLKELSTIPNICRPSKEKMADYLRRCTFLKGLIETSKLPNTVEKVVATQHLSHGPATAGEDSITKEIHQKTTAKYSEDLRSELFGTDHKDTEFDSTLRSRKNIIGSSHTNSGEGLDMLIKYHHSMQEKIADDMLSLTRNLKEQSELASSIIRKDTEIVGKSARLTEQNFDSLKSESELLAEHNKRAWKCSLWIMVGLVIMVFISMVMFMRLFKKNI